MQTRLKEKKKDNSSAPFVTRGPHKVHIQMDKNEILYCLKSVLPESFRDGRSLPLQVT